MNRGLLVVCAALCALASAASAMWNDASVAVPVERLIANLTKLTEKQPDNAKAHYALGRVRSLAFARDDREIRVVGGPRTPPSAGGDSENRGTWTGNQAPGFPLGEEGCVERTAKLDDQRLIHFREAVIHHRRAIELDAKDARFHLGLAWLLDAGSDLAPKLGWPDGAAQKSDLTEPEQSAAAKDLAGLVSHPEKRECYDALRVLGPRAMPLLVPGPKTDSPAVRDAIGRLLTEAWRDLAFASYADAFRLSIEKDRKGPSLFTTLSEEAGAAILRLVPDRRRTDDLVRVTDEVTKGPAAIKAQGRSVTPVIFPVGDDDASLADLVPEGRTALFDLDGDDVVERWPWPSADAAILVWRPDPAVPVTSGRQLFGSRTWWIFWENGYEPLAALDDDGDGRLTGAELDGICVWRDRDGDAVEDEGEVVTAAAFGVAAIETSPDATEDGVPARRRGVVLADGSTRPTYDWTPRAVVSGTP